MPLKKRTGFNENHPETREGEVFISNVEKDSALLRPGEDGYSRIGWKTKRKGMIAYDIEGNVLNWMIPVFVQREELINAGIDPDHLFEDRRSNPIPVWRWVIIGIVVAVALLWLISAFINS